jgi:NADH-quinone oxidoreductase subunit N
VASVLFYLFAYMFIVFFLSLAGIPPTAGFVGKLLIFRAAIEAGFVWLAVIGVATSAIAAYYYFMVIKAMYMDEPTGAVALSSSRPLAVGLGIMVVVTFLLGLFPNLVLQMIEAASVVQSMPSLMHRFLQTNAMTSESEKTVAEIAV